MDNKSSASWPALTFCSRTTPIDMESKIVAATNTHQRERGRGAAAGQEQDGGVFAAQNAAYPWREQPRHATQSHRPCPFGESRSDHGPMHPARPHIYF